MVEDKITHQAIQKLGNTSYYLFSKWESGKITRQFNYRIGTHLAQDPIETLYYTPEVEWVDVRKK